MIAWASLLLAGLFEIVWAIGMKYSEGFSKPGPTAITLVSLSASIALLAYSLKYLPISIAYPIWMGIGVVGIAIIGMTWLGEPTSYARILCIVLVVGGSIGLKLLS